MAVQYAGLLKSYRVRSVTGDRYGGEFPRELFRERGVEYRVSRHSKSDLYVELLPAINGERVELLDDAKLIAQLVGLERRTSRAGRDSIDHAPGGHDDVANCVAGVVFVLARRRRGIPTGIEIPSLWQPSCWKI